MLVSYKWLQTYFDTSLPEPEKLGELLTMRVLELDGLEQKQKDTVLDIKVLADRAHYCLSHRGVAGEAAAITGLVRNIPEKPNVDVQESIDKPLVNVLDEECGRYVARRIEGVTVGRSSARIVESLETLGQRSINNIVDATNFVMLDMGQPLHAFDADKLVGGITVRKARDGERMTTLDGKDVVLDSSVLLIADDEGPLAIAGIKGGTRAQVDESTKNIILESAYFRPGSTRKTSMKLGIRTDASKRFEVGITPEYAPVALAEVTALILAGSPSAKAGPVLDIYPQPAQKTVLSVDLSDINKRLGIEVPREEAVAILKRLGIEVEEKGNELVLTIPYERLDLAIPEDIAEEVGRLYGYEKLENQLPPSGVTSTIDKRNYYTEKIKDILAGLGFYEVYLYSLVAEGDFEIELPLAEDKKFLRTSLVPGISRALKFNANNAPLLGLDQIKLFEFGKVFPKDGEVLMLGLGVENAPGYKGGKPQEEIRKAMEKLAEALGLPSSALSQAQTGEGGIVEWPLDALLEKLPEPPQATPRYEINRAVRFQKFSPYPFIARDIAMWVDEGVSASDIETVLKATAGDLLVRLSLFDEYKKDARISYAFRLVFQSMDRTLTNEEINAVMTQVTQAVTAKNWEVR
ncbi:phenylalanine--tRNA ligase subunit beta [Candidatus Kaiserbacteria bacterium]|nr:phenylalanine--tRNA ligase subunit beta [Candidatus Kaiserbacteria bacterium]